MQNQQEKTSSSSVKLALTQVYANSRHRLVVIDGDAVTVIGTGEVFSHAKYFSVNRVSQWINKGDRLDESLLGEMAHSVKSLTKSNSLMADSFIAQVKNEMEFLKSLTAQGAWPEAA